MSDSVKSHLQKCDKLPEAVYSWAKDWTKDSEPFVGDAADTADSGMSFTHAWVWHEFTCVPVQLRYSKST